MSKQEEIIGGIEKLIHQAVYATAKTGAERYTDVDTSHDVKRLLNYLHSQGVVVKVDRELPINPHPKYCDSMPEMPSISYILYPEAQLDMLKAGYVAVEPLMEGVSDGNNDVS